MTAPANISFYDFTAIYPPDGFCEYQKLGPFNLFNIITFKEFGNFAICLLSGIFLGILGIYKSGSNVSSFILYLYGLIVGYGIMEGIYHATLWNGFGRIGETILKFQQSLIVVFLANTAGFSQFYGHHYIFITTVLIAGMYPMVTVVLSSAYRNAWIGWLTFDVLWFFILSICLEIWKNKESYKFAKIDAFLQMWYATGYVVIAYVLWCIDTFYCTYVFAHLYLHGIWHLLIALGYFYLTTLISCLTARLENFEPIITTYPSDKLPLIFFVEWKHIHKRN